MASNKLINEILVSRLKAKTLKGTWVELEDIPKILDKGEDVILIAGSRASLVDKVYSLTLFMRKAKIMYNHEPWIKGRQAVALAFKIVCLENNKVCYCVSEENINILKQVIADKHCRVF